jgi:hypothetical protein
MLDKKYIILIGWFFLFLYPLANGIYAMARPANWLRAKWTATRSLEPNKPLLPEEEAEIRWVLGPFFLAGSAFAGWVLIRFAIRIFSN